MIIEFIEGMNSSWTKGSKNDLKFKINGPFEMFESLEVNGKQLKKGTDYDAANGSTVISLRPGYLESLSEGNHIITARYNDRQAPFTAFSIAARPDDKKESGPDRNVKPNVDPDRNTTPYDNGDGYNKGNGSKPTGADTGDSTDMGLLLMALLSALASLAGIAFIIRSKRDMVS